MNELNNRKINVIQSKKAVEIILSIARYFFLLSLSYIVLFQLFYMISYAVRPSSEMYDPSVVWVPKTLTLDHFKLALTAMNYLKSLWVTIYIQFVSAIIEVITCAIAAYGFARFEFKGKRLLFGLVLLTILIPPQMIAVPMYLNYAHLDFLGILKGIGSLIGKDIRPNVLNTAQVFYLPSLFGVGLRSGLFIFIYRQFFKSMPKELEEAAWIDGAGPVKTFVKVIIPSSGVVILTVCIFSIVWHWNDYYLSTLYLNDKFPLSVSLAQITAGVRQVAAEDNRGVRMAGCLLFVMPILIMYAILQKRFISSIDRVGIVG